MLCIPCSGQNTITREKVHDHFRNKHDKPWMPERSKEQLKMTAKNQNRRR